MNCTVRDMTNGFSCVFLWRRLKTSKHLRGPESTRGEKKKERKKERQGKGSLVVCNIVLDHADSRTVRDVG